MLRRRTHHLLQRVYRRNSIITHPVIFHLYHISPHHTTFPASPQRTIRADLKSMRCLVTGASGFIGSAVSQNELAQNGHRVRAGFHTTSLPYREKQVEYVVADLTDPAFDFIPDL